MRAMLFTVQPAVQPMGEGGAVMFIGSVAGALANPAMVPVPPAGPRYAYAGTRYTEHALRRIGGYHNQPGPIDTSCSTRIAATSGRRWTGTPAKGPGDPDTVAAEALFPAKMRHLRQRHCTGYRWWHVYMRCFIAARRACPTPHWFGSPDGRAFGSCHEAPAIA